jgi:flagellar biosynthesis protein FlhA
MRATATLPAARAAATPGPGASMTAGADARIGAGTTAGELALPLALVAIVLVMVVPLPALVLDLLLAVSISIALLVLTVGMHLREPLELSTFPSLLLVVTLFRLGLNVAATRMILLHGHEGPDAAGHVIQAFGTFVVGGSYAVGAVVFLILVIVNFVVITKGAGRIAEVAARFTLDAMPGKQLAIDADVACGRLTVDEARARRRAIEAEADFHGAMDGASKFVRGDAIAGLVITAVDVVGGLAIGVGQHGLGWRDAAQTYTVLTIGEGLVSQLPALLVSTAAGIVVTRAASGAALGREITAQLFASPRVLWVVTGIVGVLALVPGLPFLPFIALAGATGALAAAGGVAPAVEHDGAGTTAGPGERPTDLLPALDPMELDLGVALLPLVDGREGGPALVERIRALRQKLAQETGFVVPPIHVRDDPSLPPEAYAVLLKGIELARGEVHPEGFLAIDPGTVAAPVAGVTVREPAFGLDALWIAAAEREDVERAGYTVVDPASVVVMHVTELVRRHAHELLGRQEVQALLDELARSRPAVVDELVPALLGVGAVQRVLQNLLREGVSIRDLATVLEVLADHAGRTKDPDLLTEHARRALARTITRKLAAPDGTLAVVSLAPSLERMLADAVEHADGGPTLRLDPATAERLIGALGAWVERAAADGLPPVLLCGAALRAGLRRFVERYLPTLTVVTPAEITPATRVRALGVVALDDA